MGRRRLASISRMDSPVEVIAGALDAGVLFLCDHASNAVPPAYGDLGLPPSEFSRHIAFDIGAATLTRRLAATFGAPAVLARFSRLLIDANRGADDPTLVMRLSDGAIIPGNAHVDSVEIERRRQLFWRPYRDAVAALIDTMLARGPVPAIVSIHSFTPVWKQAPRPWPIAVLWDKDPRIAEPLMRGLADTGMSVGNNEPYDGALEGDTLYFHATSRGLAHVLIEVRQDLVADDAGAAEWAERLAKALRPILARPDTHIIKHYGSRVGRLDVETR
jgi:predicted N-formylglutamate amidohydrolase